jgi:PPP family 3-phenylpropionic acid transporter
MSVQLEATDVQEPHQEISSVLPRHGFTIVKLYYFFFFFAIGAIAPYFSIYLQQRGLSGSQIGLVLAAPPLIALVASPFWGAVVDRWQAPRRVLALCASMAGVISIFFLGIYSFTAILITLVIMNFFRSPISPLLDSAAMKLVSEHGASYGRQRLFGSIGFVLASYGLGWIVTEDNLNLVFWMHAIALGVACATLSLALPVRVETHRTALSVGLRILLAQPGYRSLLIAMLMLGMSAACYITFLGLHILTLGGTPAMVGLAFAGNAISEIPVMFLGDRWFARVSYRRTIVVALAGFSVVWALMALAWAPWQLIVITPLTGVCFGLTWMAVVGYANGSAPTGLGASAQTLINAVHGGLGWAIGTALAGMIWDVGGGQLVFVTASGIIAIGASVFAFGTRR